MTKRTYAYNDSIIKFILIMVVLILYLLLSWVSFAQDIADELKLKCPKEKIINSKLIEDEYIIDEKGKEKKLEPFINYSYISETKVPQQTNGKLKEDISKRTKNSLHFPVKKVGNKEEWIGKFFTGDTFYQADDEWYQIEWGTTTPDAFEKQTKEKHSFNILSWAYADSLSVGPGTGDGWITYTTGGGSTWNAAHNAGTGTSRNYTYTTSQTFCASAYALEGANLFSIGRSFLPIDTSALGASAVPSAATFTAYIKAKTNDVNDTKDYINLVGATTQPLTTELQVADYDLCATVHTPPQWATAIDIGTLTINAYNTWTFNATGLAGISLTGTTMLGAREGHDIEDSVGGSSGTNSANIYYAGSALVPYLIVTYTTASARHEMFMVE